MIKKTKRIQTSGQNLRRQQEKFAIVCDIGRDDKKPNVQHTGKSSVKGAGKKACVSRHMTQIIFDKGVAKITPLLPKIL